MKVSITTVMVNSDSVDTCTFCIYELHLSMLRPNCRNS